MAKRTGAIGVEGLLSKVSKKTTSSKVTTPQVQVPDALAPHVRSFVEAHRDMNLAESRKKDAAAQMQEFANEQRIDLSRKSGGCYSSVKLSTKDGTSCRFVTAKRFSGMKVEDNTKDILEAAFGSEYDKYFAIVPQIKISNTITDSQASKLVEVLTKAKLMDIIEVNPIIKGTDRLFTDMVLNSKIAAITDRVCENDGLCKQITYFRV